MTVLGTDVSFYQDDNNTIKRPDFVKMKSEGIVFVYIRAGQNTWPDDDFEYNWSEAKKAGLLRGTYWYLDWRSDHLVQAQKFFDLVKATGDFGELPPVVDYEQRLYLPTNGAGTMRQRLKEFLEKTKTLFGKTPAIYTGPNYWQTYGSADTYWKQYPLWIAHYGVLTQPIVPLPWLEWKFWQYTDKGDGIKYGVESLQIDMDYFNGSYEDLLIFAGISATIPEPPPVVEPLTLDQRVEALEAKTKLMEEKLQKMSEILNLYTGGVYSGLL